MVMDFPPGAVIYNLHIFCQSSKKLETTHALLLFGLEIEVGGKVLLENDQILYILFFSCTVVYTR